MGMHVRRRPFTFIAAVSSLSTRQTRQCRSRSSRTRRWGQRWTARFARLGYTATHQRPSTPCVRARPDGQTGLAGTSGGTMSPALPGSRGTCWAVGGRRCYTAIAHNTHQQSSLKTEGKWMEASNGNAPGTRGRFRPPRRRRAA